jgi:hypothetical protein
MITPQLASLVQTCDAFLVAIAFLDTRQAQESAMHRLETLVAAMEALEDAQVWHALNVPTLEVQWLRI